MGVNFLFRVVGAVALGLGGWRLGAYIGDTRGITGFLDNGTMVVVEGTKRYINTHLDVQIARVLQMAVGRIIFQRKLI